jgi:acyl-CoA thioester hydrolase
MRKQGILVATVETVVPFHDVDMASVVWHGHYLKYLENARWALMARLDFGLDAMIASGYAWPVVEVHAKYVRTARFGDRLQVQASLVEWESRLTINYLIKDAATAERVARAQTVQVAVEVATGALQFVTPAVLRERIVAATRTAARTT